MKKKEIVNNINLYFKYIYIYHLFFIIYIMFLFKNQEVIGVFNFSFLSLLSYIFIKNNLNMYKNKEKKEFSKNVKIWLKEKKVLIFVMFLLNIVNLLFFLLENIIPSLLYLFISLIIYIAFIVIYMNFLFNNKLLNNYSFHDIKYYKNKKILNESIQSNLKNENFLKTYKYLKKYENYFKKVYKDYIYSSSDYYIFILFSKEEIKISKKKEIKLNKLKNKFEKSFDKLSLS